MNDTFFLSELTEVIPTHQVGEFALVSRRTKKLAEVIKNFLNKECEEKIGTKGDFLVEISDIFIRGEMYGYNSDVVFYIHVQPRPNNNLMQDEFVSLMKYVSKSMKLPYSYTRWSCNAQRGSTFQPNTFWTVGFQQDVDSALLHQLNLPSSEKDLEEYWSNLNQNDLTYWADLPVWKESN
jgi:hypothetical protein